MSAVNKNKVVWNIFYILLIIIFVDILASFLGVEIDKNNFFRFLLLCIPVILLLLHSFFTLSFVRGLFFIILASTVGLLMEMWGLKDGVVFGGHYVYKQNQLALFNVPVSVILYWAVFIYTGYCLINSFLVWLKYTKTNL